MILIVIFGGLVLLLLVIFVKSALFLLPWTITAAVLAGLSGIGLGKLAGRSRASGTAISVGTCLVLTIAFGYLGCMLVPPTAPPQKKGLEFLLTALEPSQKDLWQTLPFHLGIVAIIGALIVRRLSSRISPDLDLCPERIAESHHQSEEFPR